MRKGNTANARECALSVLVACRRNGAWADAALKAQLGKCALSAQDAALCSRIVYGVMQNELLLNYYLGAYCTQKLDHLQPPLADILRIGAYQILFLDKVPNHAAVSESVELCRMNGRSAASGLVNAVLRKVAQNKAHLPALPQDALSRLSIAYSHPKWLVKKLVALLGEDKAEQFLRTDNEAAPMTVQVNPLKTDGETLARELMGDGVKAAPHEWVPGCFELSGTGDLTTLASFYQGRFTVQDAAARLVTYAAGFEKGQKVLDVCAAPGGKSFAAAFAMENEGDILACDLHENKLKRIREGAQRLGITCIETAAADGRIFRPEWEGKYDTVVCDVPCSGLGIIRKKPDIRYKDAAELAALPEIQRAILDNSARYVRAGGVLVYSTCTVLPEENEHVTDAFLAAHPDFTYEEFSLPNGDAAPGRLTLWPQRNGTDGFYLSRMRRKA